MKTSNLDKVSLPETERKEFTERLIFSLRESEITQSPTILCKILKIKEPKLVLSVHAVRKWLHAESVPTQNKLKLLADLLNVNPHWLRYGQELKVRDNKIKKSNKNILNEYNFLDLRQKKYILEIVKALAEQHKKKLKFN
jgi:hypothetical protein